MRDPEVILDTNVFVAAGFNPDSASAHILKQVRAEQLHLIWNEQTRRETQHILKKIPPLSWSKVSNLFRDGDRYDGETDPEQFDFIPDRDDRKFAALAAATGAVLITNDEHFLAYRDQIESEILTPGEYWGRQQG